MQSEFEKWWNSERDHCYAEDKDYALSVWNAAWAALLAHEKALKPEEPRAGCTHIVERVITRLIAARSKP